MAPRIIKLSKKDDLTAAIKHIKASKDREIVFEVEKGSPILANSEGMRLMKKTAEVLGKDVKVDTTDTNGRLLAKKVGVLASNSMEAKSSKPTKARATMDSSRRGGQFSDIMIPKRKEIKKAAVKPTIEPIKPKKEISEDFAIPIIRQRASEEGSRLEFEVARRSSKFSKIFVLCLVVLVVTVFGLAVLLPQAEITIFARSESVSRDFEIIVDRAVAARDTTNMQIPGVFVSKEFSQTRTFNSTGTRTSGTKASGTITIYNMTANTLTLRAATTTLIAGGKRFSFTRDVSGIRPNGTANTGIPIVAQEGGADYNLAANTRFQIVNAALGNQNVYAINPEALSGGTTSTAAKVVSTADIDNATDALLADVVNVAEEELTAANSVKIRLLNAGVKKEVLAKTANKNVGDEAESFDMTLIARVTGLAFREDDVTKVIEDKINEVLSSDKYLLEGQQKYQADYKSVDPTLSKGVLAVHFDTIAAYRVGENELPKVLAGKNESEIKEILLSKPEVDNVNVKFWPDWFVHKAPKFNGKIRINIVLTELENSK
jgi:hypothetical protein